MCVKKWTSIHIEVHSQHKHKIGSFEPYFLLDTVLTEFLLPLPGTLQHLFSRCLSLPAQHLVGLVYITPYLFDITFTTWCKLPVHLHACSLLKALNNL